MKINRVIPASLVILGPQIFSEFLPLLYKLDGASIFLARQTATFTLVSSNLAKKVPKHFPNLVISNLSFTKFYISWHIAGKNIAFFLPYCQKQLMK